MPRTDAGSVKKILQADYDSTNNPTLDPYITAANLVVTRLRATASDNDLPVPTTAETLLVHAIAHPRSIEIRRRPGGEDLALRVRHPDGSTLLTFHDRPAAARADEP